MDEPPHIEPVDDEQREGYEDDSEYYGESDYGFDGSTIDGGLGLSGNDQRRIRWGQSVERGGSGRFERRLATVQLIRRGNRWRHAGLQGVGICWFVVFSDNGFDVPLLM